MNHNFKASQRGTAEKINSGAGSMVEVFLNDPVELNVSPERIEETIYREDQPSLSPDKPLRPAFTLELSKERERSIER